MSIGVQKNWPYKNAIVEKLRKLQEHGSIDHLATKYSKISEGCTDTDSDSDLSLSIFKLIMPFLILCFGIVLAVFCLSYELLRRRINFLRH